MGTKPQIPSWDATENMERVVCKTSWLLEDGLVGPRKVKHRITT